MSDEQFDFKKFAAERSTKNSAISSDLGKAAAQAAILINGGAATAILSFVKGASEHGFAVAIGTAGYGLGVLAGAWMIYCMNQLLDSRNEFWQSYFNPDKLGLKYRESSSRRSTTWLRLKNLAFAISVLCFVLSSIWLSFALYK
jgi:hypothetical protein